MMSAVVLEDREEDIEEETLCLNQFLQEEEIVSEVPFSVVFDNVEFKQIQGVIQLQRKFRDYVKGNGEDSLDLPRKNESKHVRSITPGSDAKHSKSLEYRNQILKQQLIEAKLRNSKNSSMSTQNKKLCKKNKFQSKKKIREQLNLELIKLKSDNERMQKTLCSKCQSPEIMSIINKKSEKSLILKSLLSNNRSLKMVTSLQEDAIASFYLGKDVEEYHQTSIELNNELDLVCSKIQKAKQNITKYAKSIKEGTTSFKNLTSENVQLKKQLNIYVPSPRKVKAKKTSSQHCTTSTSTISELEYHISKLERSVEKLRQKEKNVIAENVKQIKDFKNKTLKIHSMIKETETTQNIVFEDKKMTMKFLQEVRGKKDGSKKKVVHSSKQNGNNNVSNQPRLRSIQSSRTIRVSNGAIAKTSLTARK